MRRIVLLLGVAAVVVGAWSVHRVHLEESACQAQSNYRPGFGASATCLDQFSFTWLAFGVLVAGIFAILFSLLLMRRNRNMKGISGDRRERLIGTPGEDRTLREHYQRVYGSAAASTSAEPAEGTEQTSPSPS